MVGQFNWMKMKLGEEQWFFQQVEVATVFIERRVKQLIGKKNKDFHDSLRFILHRSLQYFTSCQTSAHFFLQENGRLQTKQIFSGKCCFLTPRMISKQPLLKKVLPAIS
jgi:hypothetical protein